MDIIYSNYVKILSDGSLKAAEEILKTGSATYDHPSVRLLNKLGYFRFVETEDPGTPEGKKVVDMGFRVVTEGDDKVVKHVWNVLTIVDCDAPAIMEDEEIVRDYWLETEDEFVHKYVVVKVVDEEPELADDQVVVSSEWILDEAAGTKTKVYSVRTKVDSTPVLEEGQTIVSDWWEDDGMFYTHLYCVRIVVDDPPVLEDGQKVVEEWWDDDGITRTHRYEVRKVVDEEPVLEDGQEIVNDWWEDDGTTKTHRYEVRKVVDNPPELSDDQFIKEEWWDDDGTTRTHFYDVWTVIDSVPTYDAETQRLFDLGWEDDDDSNVRTHKYTVKDIVDEVPSEDPGEGFVWTKDGDVEDETTIRVTYVKKAVPVVRYSKMYLEIGLAKLGKLDAFDALLDAEESVIDIGGGVTMSARRLYETANDLCDGNPLFKQLFDRACALLGIEGDAKTALLNMAKSS